jgi:hypothetical protein
MTTNMKQMYEDLIQCGLLRIKNGKLSLKRPNPVARELAKTSPNFEAFRKNMNEFKHVGKAGKMIRDAIKEISDSNPTMHHRLIAVLFKVLKRDITNKKGERSIMAGDLSLLNGFQFNEHSSIHSVAHFNIDAKIDPKKGRAIIKVPFVIPAHAFKWPDHASLAEIDSLLVSINFDQEAVEVSRASSERISRKVKEVFPFQLISEVNESENRDLLLCVAVRFFSEINGHVYHCKTRNCNPVDIVSVERGK